MSTMNERENDVVMDGRDIGTNILPNAEVKIYLTASSAKVAVTAPKTTVRADLNYERVRVNDPNSSIVIAEDPHIKQIYKQYFYVFY